MWILEFLQSALLKIVKDLKLPQFEATSFPLPIVQGPADYRLPTDCIVSSLAVNRATGWRIVNHGGFNLSINNDTFLQVTSN